MAGSFSCWKWKNLHLLFYPGVCEKCWRRDGEIFYKHLPGFWYILIAPPPYQILRFYVKYTPTKAKQKEADIDWRSGGLNNRWTEEGALASRGRLQRLRTLETRSGCSCEQATMAREPLEWFSAAGKMLRWAVYQVLIEPTLRDLCLWKGLYSI